MINRRTPKTNAAVKALVPIRAECWNAKEPGWLEADTVAHCGGDIGAKLEHEEAFVDTKVIHTWHQRLAGHAKMAAPAGRELPLKL